MTGRLFKFIVAGADADAAVTGQVNTLVIAGWTGRDEAALQAHIEELRALGVAPPKSVPIFYRVDASLLTQAHAIQVAGRESSGEVEAVLIKLDGELYVCVGSDHTDRALETVGITLSKQVCAKPIGATLWRWTDVADRWDQVRLESFLPSSGELYQTGAAEALRRPDELLALYEQREGELPDGSALFCGTLPAHGGIRFADRMRVSLIDPVTGREIRHDYRVEALPIAEA